MRRRVAGSRRNLVSSSRVALCGFFTDAFAVAYGNEAYMDTIYATVAILVEIVRGKDDSSTSAASEET